MTSERATPLNLEKQIPQTLQFRSPKKDQDLAITKLTLSDYKIKIQSKRDKPDSLKTQRNRTATPSMRGILPEYGIDY